MRRSPLRSPPRMRGKVHPAHHAEQGDGITPAYAGKSRCNLPSTAPWKDHPRVCGEKASPMMKPAPPLGSPPRVRGKAKKRCRSCPLTRITPAYAGKRPAASAARSAKWDHPRVCGEKGCCKFSSRNHSGSPPRMRGKDLSDNELQVLDGITPACAGREKRRDRLDYYFPQGSPPRVRGKASQYATSHPAARITPAYAGKRAWFSYCGCQDRDHPRVCGEKALSTFSSRKNSGSPPRMRGKAGRALEGACIPGITPAYAGKSMMLHHSIPDTAAHDGRQVLRGLRRHLKCDRDGHLRFVQVGNVVHERALMPDVHESQSRRTPQRHNDRMGQPVQAGMHGRSHGCRGRAAAPKCPAHHPWLLPPCRMVIRPRP